MFQMLKQMLTCAPVLAFTDFSPPFVLQTGGSLKGLSAVLTQVQDGRERVIAYASRCTRENEKNQSNNIYFRLELLAVVWDVMEKFADILTGTEFLLLMDHNPLVYL